MQRLPGERIPLVIAEGPFAGLSAEVEALGVELTRLTAIQAVNAYVVAENADLLEPVYALFVDEAQPTWALADHRGPIPATVEGMWRLPIRLALAFVDLWVDPPTSAVDELVPPGPVRDALNRSLREARKD